MAIFCNREIMEAVKDLELPLSKADIIAYIDKKKVISEASSIALNKLEDREYRSVDEICENVKIVCDLEITGALKDMYFPATRDDILDYVRMRNFSEFVVRSLDDLPHGYTYKSVSDICKEI